MNRQASGEDRRPFLNRTRLIVYPRLFLMAQIFVFLLNFALRDNYVGRISGVFGFDFLVFYSSGVLYRQSIDQLYDINSLATLEQALIYPTSLHGGFNVNSYPPYVALLTSTLTFMPYLWAFLAWTGLSLIALFVTSRWLAERLVPVKLRIAGLTSNQMLVLLLSSVPVWSGLQVGQNNSFTLLLITGIIINTIERKPIPAGLMAGFLIYKPQFVLGFLVLWLVWKEYRALIAAGLVASAWAGSVIVLHGFDPYINYFNQLQNLLRLPFGASQAFETTPLALLATLLPVRLAPLVASLSLFVMIVGLVLIAWTAHRFRHMPGEFQYALLILAGLYPFIATPHVLMYDLAVLAPLLVLWSHLSLSRWLLFVVIGVYVGSLILLLISEQLNIALLGLLSLGILAGLTAWYRKKFRTLRPIEAS